MRSSKAASRGPKTRARREAPSSPRLTTIYFNSDDDTDSATRLRVQFLGSRFGLSAVRAQLVAALAFGEAAHV